MALRKHEMNNSLIRVSDRDELKLISPYACMVAGCTGSGKSRLVLSWLKTPHLVFRENYRKIYYFHGSAFQDAFKDPLLKHVCFSKDFKLLEKLASTKHDSQILIILDDLMNMTGSSEVILDLYTKGSHHCNIDIINIVQNIFHQGKGSTFSTMKGNTQYVVLKQHVNETKLPLIANALGVSPFELTAVYNECMSTNRYSEILIDNHISSNIKKITKLRNDLHRITPVLYISDEKFEMYTRKNVIRPDGCAGRYYIDINMLKDK